jgi:riboflavin biosynthesis pyrimidine reductase
MRQLFPVLADPVDPVTVYRDTPRVHGRPWVRLNMIASIDGATTVAGRSGGLGGPADRRLYVLLRSLADVVLVGASTMRTEGYGPALLPPALRDARRQRGQTPVPAIAVVSRSCKFDWQSRFFAAATVRPIVITVANAPAEHRARAAEVADVVLAGKEDVEVAWALDAIAERGARSVLCEGGPNLAGQLASAGLLDELALTLSPRLTGGDAKRILEGPALTEPLDVQLCSVCEEDGFLFFRFLSR